MSAENISTALKTLPRKAGVYQFRDKTGKVIYVGKAKNLKARVSSYFNKKNYESAKTRILVSKTNSFRFFVVANEYEALLLENNMIKKYQPRYNIQLKDDKTYPFICLKKERFPRVFPTRNVVRDGSEYFGPYASVKMMNTLLELIRQLYPLRNCSFNLSEDLITGGRYKVCLEYHVKNCLGPCEGLQTETDYNESIDSIRQILKGHSGMVIRHLKERMNEFSTSLAYEKAALIKSKLDILSHFKGKSTVVSTQITDVDVFSMVDDKEAGYVNYLKVINGAIVQGHTLELKRRFEESSQEMLLLAIVELRQRFASDSSEIILPFEISLSVPGVSVTVPQRGEKKKLLELSERNARFFMIDKLKRLEHVDPDKFKTRVLEQLMGDLRLPELPVHIECFDNSNFQGTSAVAACVVFKNGRPSKKDYRHFNIKTVAGPDDFASMEEIIHRRYSRLLAERQSLPQLVVIDGGKGQLGAALKSIDALGLRGRISIIGIAKKLEEIYFPGDQLPLYLDKRSESLKIIQQLRNEAHRFGISHHRDRRSKSALGSALSSIKGVGKETEKLLLLKFKSVEKIRSSSLEQLEAVIGKKRAKVVFEQLGES